MFIHRALNYSRKSFMPTYVGLRYMLDQIPRQRTHGFITKMIEKKGKFFSEERYRSYTYYKGSSEDGTIEYRLCSAPSPTALLVESYLLEKIAQKPDFQPSSNVYSYNFPNANSKSIFNYFYSGYLNRSKAIEASMKARSNNVALLVDIRRFYPMVINEDVKSSLNFLVSQNDFSKATRKVIHAVAGGFLDGSKKGLPIGPPMSHFLANLALREVDYQLSMSFANRYFRYVDDMCVVVPARSIDVALRDLTRVIEDAGYQINSTKTTVVRDASYFSADFTREYYNMSTLRSSIIAYITLKPGNTLSLTQALRDIGCNIPIQMLTLTSNSPSWKGYLAALLHQGQEREEIALALRGRKSIVKYAQRLRERTIRKADALLEGDSVVRNKKFYVKQVRRLLINLIYLTPLSQMERLTLYCKDLPELQELRVLCQACAHGRIDELIWFPGSTTDVFSQVWAGSGNDSPIIQWPRKLAPPQRDAIAKLTLSGIIAPPKDDVTGIGNQFQSFISGRISGAPMRSIYAYDDEVCSLRAGSPEMNPSDFDKIRFDESEQLPFYAFGGEYYGQ